MCAVMGVRVHCQNSCKYIGLHDVADDELNWKYFIYCN